MKRRSLQLVFEEEDLNEEAVERCITQNKKIKKEKTDRLENKKEEEADEKPDCQSPHEDGNPAKRRKTVRRMKEEIPGNSAVTVEGSSDDPISDSLDVFDGKPSIDSVVEFPKKRVFKRCNENGCAKQSQGGGKCKAHGGGQRCGVKDCPKSAEGKTGKCAAHGGGKRCEVKDCPKSAEGKTGKCKAHGGGQRCGVKDCPKSARGKTGKCQAHGGGQRCGVKDCHMSAEGNTGKCKAHVGGERCRVQGCLTSARSKGGKCAKHNK